MKKKVLGIVAVMLVAIVSVVSLVACGDKAGAKAMQSQMDALLEVKAGRSDVAVLDSTMAGYLINKEDSDFKDLQIVKLSDYTPELEQYGVAAKKGNLQLIDKLNQELALMYESGEFQKEAENWGLADRMIDITYTAPSTPITDKSWDNIIAKKKVVIGYTVNPPMGTAEASGFDIELAKDIFGKYGVTVEAKIITWDMKVVELNNNNIDLVWNGMTIKDELLQATQISNPYLTNEQVFVVKKSNAEKFKTKADVMNARVAYEKGSAATGTIEALGFEVPKEK